jgi:hypothetical protein
MPEAHVLFTGIVALIPKADGTYHVVLANQSNNPMGHVAHVLAEMEHVSAPTKPVTWTGVHPHDANSLLGVWYLYGETISIGGMYGGKVDDSNSAYIATMNDFTGDLSGAADFSKSLYALMDERYIAARVDLTGGTLEASYVRPDVEWYFEPAHGPKPGWIHLAEEVCFHFPVASSLELTFQRFGSSRVDVMSLFPNDLNQIEVRIGNLPTEQIIPTVANYAVESTDYHFNLYYDMADSPPLERALPDSRNVYPPVPGMPQETKPHKITMAPDGTSEQVAERVARSRWLRAKEDLRKVGQKPLSSATLRSGASGATAAKAHMHSMDMPQADPSEEGVVGPNCPPAVYNKYT